MSFIRDDVTRFALITGGDRGDLVRSRLNSSPETAFGAYLGSLGGSIAALGIHLLLADPRRDDVHTTAPINAALAFGMRACMSGLGALSANVVE